VRQPRIVVPQLDQADTTNVVYVLFAATGTSDITDARTSSCAPGGQSTRSSPATPTTYMRSTGPRPWLMRTSMLPGADVPRRLVSTTSAAFAERLPPVRQLPARTQGPDSASWTSR